MRMEISGNEGLESIRVTERVNEWEVKREEKRMREIFENMLFLQLNISTNSDSINISNFLLLNFLLLLIFSLFIPALFLSYSLTVFLSLSGIISDPTLHPPPVMTVMIKGCHQKNDMNRERERKKEKKHRKRKKMRKS